MLWSNSIALDLDIYLNVNTYALYRLNMPYDERFDLKSPLCPNFNINQMVSLCHLYCFFHYRFATKNSLF